MKTKVKKNSNFQNFRALLLAFTLIFFMGGCANSVSSAGKESKPATTSQSSDTKGSNEANKIDSSASSTVSGQLKVSYINVGQADSILIQQGSQAMLIDAGNNGDSKTVSKYISDQGVTKLDFLVGTHPHEDHIGGMDYIINNFQIGKIYMPKVTANTKTFKDVATAIKNKGMKATVPTLGETFKLGDANCTILGPINSDPKDLNSYSIVIKIVFGNNKFLFTGDAQTSNESDMINKGYDLSADVLKVGHHGSHTSTADAFLTKVNPKYVVISCGKGNDYGHPHKETMDRLKAKGIPVYRTDESGTIVAISDGKGITFNCSPGDYKYGSAGSATINNNSSSSSESTNNGTAISEAATASQVAQSDNKSTIVYITKSGKKYHNDGCSSLAKSKIAINLGDAKSQGYDACSICNPPK